MRCCEVEAKSVWVVAQWMESRLGECDRRDCNRRDSGSGAWELQMRCSQRARQESTYCRGLQLIALTCFKST